MTPQHPSEDWLARRIIERYGQSSGLVSTKAILRQAARLNRSGIDRLPLLASLQRRYAPARTYLSGGRSELHHAWPFAAARTLAPASAIISTVGRRENVQSGSGTSKPLVSAAGSRSETPSTSASDTQSPLRPVGSVKADAKVPTFAPAMAASRPPARKEHPADRAPADDRETGIAQRLTHSMSRPIRRVNRRAESEGSMPAVQPALRSAFTSSQAGSMDLHRGLEGPSQLPKGDSSQQVHNPIPPVSRFQHILGTFNLGDSIVHRLSRAPLGLAAQPPIVSSLPLVQRTPSAAVQPPVPSPSRDVHLPIGPDRPPARPPSLTAGTGVASVATDTAHCIGESTPAFSNERLGGLFSSREGSCEFSPFANRVTIQRTVQSGTTSHQHMPLAVPPKPVMRDAEDTPQIHTRSTAGERQSSPEGPTVEEASLRESMAESVFRQISGPEYGDELMDRILRRLKRQLAVESERRGWQPWP